MVPWKLGFLLFLVVTLPTPPLETRIKHLFTTDASSALLLVWNWAPQLKVSIAQAKTHPTPRARKVGQKHQQQHSSGPVQFALLPERKPSSFIKKNFP